MIMNNTIGSRIRTIRKHFRLTQTEFAKKLGISASFISSIETSKKNPSLETLKKMFEMKVNLNYLVTGQGNCFIEEEKVNTGEIIDPAVKDTDDPDEILKKMKWYADNVPIVRHAMIEAFLSYLLTKPSQVEAALKRVTGKEKDKEG